MKEITSTIVDFLSYSQWRKFLKITSKVDVDPRSFKFIHDKPPLPRQSK